MRGRRRREEEKGGGKDEVSTVDSGSEWKCHSVTVYSVNMFNSGVSMSPTLNVNVVMTVYDCITTV